MIKESTFRSYIEKLDVDVDSCVANLRSLSRGSDIYEYHKSTAYELLMEITPKNNKDALMLVLSPRAESKAQNLAIQANVQAAIHAARSLYDIFAQLLNKVVLHERLSVRECMLYKVRPLITEPTLKEALDCVVGSESYKYISAFVNTIKHRDLVYLGANLDLVENKVGLKFESFSYSNETYPSLWGIDALKHSLNAKNAVISLVDIFEQHTLQKFV